MESTERCQDDFNIFPAWARPAREGERAVPDAAAVGWAEPQALVFGLADPHGGALEDGLDGLDGLEQLRPWLS
jgi:hypothetical protein